MNNRGWNMRRRASRRRMNCYLPQFTPSRSHPGRAQPAGRLIWRLRANHWRGIANPAQALQLLQGRHLGFAPDEAHRRGGVPFLEKWDGSLAVPAKMAATNKYLARSNKSRTGSKATNRRNAMNEYRQRSAHPCGGRHAAILQHNKEHCLCISYLLLRLYWP
jgi:hypothetical protein